MAAVDALVSKIILDALPSTKQRDFRLIFCVNKQFRKLISNLQSIQAILINGDEKTQLQDPTVRLWLDRLKSVAYDTDNVLDLWNYENLKSQIIARKVWSFNTFRSCLLFTCFNFPVDLQQGLTACFYCLGDIPHPFYLKISNINLKLTDIAADKDNCGILSLRGDNEHVQKWRTGSTVAIEIDIPVKGRELEKSRLVNLLLTESSEVPKLHVISILGMAGIGKTTLAQLVFNDGIVKSHFDRRIWVSVPKSFDTFRVAKAILELLEGHTLDIVEFGSIAMKIQQSIEGKRVLLVLDDVWNEDPNKWKQLEDCLICGSSGSKILVTTRNETVAKLMGCTDLDIFRVGFLSEEECLSLFSEIAFSSEERQNLETMSAKIVARCKGLPLAVKTIAGILRYRNSKREWENVLGSELWKFEEVQHDIFGPLWLSYFDLPSPLKLCFLYCVVFPKGYRMSKDELISLWIAHGFLKPTEEYRDVEMVGHDYFYNLGIRSLFQDYEVVEKFNKLDKTYCKMHDIVHGFAKYLMEKECLCIDVKSAEEVTSSVNVEYNDSLYHLHVKLGEKVEFHDSFYNMRKLRSLVILPPNNSNSLIGAALPKIFERFTCLRSLSLSRCCLETIPSSINKLIHLRWLKLSKNYGLKKLPESICELYNLQTLSVNWCDGLIHFPRGVDRLTKLRHLKNDYTYFLLPKKFGNLSSLRKLLRITIDPIFQNSFCLRDLKKLNNISGSLTIFFKERKRGTLVNDGKQAQLKEKRHITALNLNFPGRPSEEWMQQEDEKLVEALNPPPSLEMLRMSCYMGANYPSWINNLASLKKLKLWYWSNCEHLPDSLGMLPCLECIEFNSFGSVKRVTAEFFRTESSSSTTPLFPKLTSMQFMNMIEWEEWNDYDGDEQVMPCLGYLSIENCPKLKALPNFILNKATLHTQIS